MSCAATARARLGAYSLAAGQGREHATARTRSAPMRGGSGQSRGSCTTPKRKDSTNVAAHACVSRRASWRSGHAATTVGPSAQPRRATGRRPGEHLGDGDERRARAACEQRTSAATHGGTERAQTRSRERARRRLGPCVSSPGTLGELLAHLAVKAAPFAVALTHHRRSPPRVRCTAAKRSRREACRRRSQHLTSPGRPRAQARPAPPNLARRLAITAPARKTGTIRRGPVVTGIARAITDVRGAFTCSTVAIPDEDRRFGEPRIAESSITTREPRSRRRSPTRAPRWRKTKRETDHLWQTVREWWLRARSAEAPHSPSSDSTSSTRQTVQMLQKHQVWQGRCTSWELDLPES